MSPRAIPEAPRLVLAADALAGGSRAPQDRLLEVLERFREPESLAVTFSKALDAGADGVLAPPLPVVRAALGELKREVPMFAVLPALTELDRLELEPGVESLIERARRRAGPWARARATAMGMVHPLAASRGDVLVRVPQLLELEIAGSRLRALRGIVLHPALTDLALAAGHARFFDHFVRWVHRRYRTAAAFETRNLGHLLVRLESWGVKPDFVVGPFNRAGLQMKPDAAAVGSAVRGCGIPLVAREMRAGGVHPLEVAARWALEHGAHGLAPDIADLDDVGQELRRLAAMRGEAASERMAS